jgi:hypothetical protein
MMKISQQKNAKKDQTDNCKNIPLQNGPESDPNSRCDQQSNPYNVNYNNYLESNSSATECTGLIPIDNENRTEWEHYRDLYHFGGYK